MPWEAWVLGVLLVLAVFFVIGSVAEDLRANQDPYTPSSYPYIKRSITAPRTGRHRIK